MHRKIDQDLYDQVLDIVVEVTNRSRDQIQPTSRMFQDLGVDGMDGERLFELLQNKFTVDLSTVQFDRHFGPELPFIPFVWLYWLIFDRKRLNAKGTAWKMVPITVLDLYVGALTGKFPDLKDRPRE